MDIQALSPEVIQDTQQTPITTDSILSNLIDPTFSSTYIDLISAPLGSSILAISDEWFAPATNLLTPTPPIHRPGVFVPTGAWYDGWETRRHNPAPYDWVIVKLGVTSGRVRGVEIDTAFFDGNHAEAVSVQGVFETGEGADERVVKLGKEEWERGEVLGRRECGASRRQGWKIASRVSEVTHVRLLMFPDGGIARFRLYGEAVPVFPEDRSTELELSAAIMGGVAVGCSDEHFGKRGNLLMPGRGKDMGDGWETKRSRESGHVDWVAVRLGARGVVTRVVVDTAHFRGNFPQSVQVDGMDAEGEDVVMGNDKRWTRVFPQNKLLPDREHVFSRREMWPDAEGKIYTHMKMTIIPDGGVKRFRVFGTRT